MRIIKYQQDNQDSVAIGLVQADHVIPLATGVHCLTDLLHSPDPASTVAGLIKTAGDPVPLAAIQILPPIDDQEVWGAGVTYERSKSARERESDHAATFYDLVYRADRPELFFKATSNRVVGPGGTVRVRADSKWSVPEPELALVLSPSLELVGFTIGNDMSARDIEGSNPLYLPQAKVYSGCCALGPWITLKAAFPDIKSVEIEVVIARNGATAFSGRTALARMARTFEELIGWLGRDNEFPKGAILLTGTGIIPPDDFALQTGDQVSMTIEGVGTLVNSVG